MRFQVNEVLPAVAIIYAGKSQGSNMFFKPYYPWWEEVVESVEFEHFTVIEHQRVRAHDEAEAIEPTYDGFRLKSSKGEDWGNQFPVARVGEFSRLSDTYDRLFTRTLSDNELMTRYYECSEVPCQYRLLSDYLADLKHGIVERNASQEQSEKDQQHTALLQKHLDDMVTQYEAEFGKTTNFTKTRFGFWEVSFVEKVEATASLSIVQESRY